jgi:hypothetical protein
MAHEEDRDCAKRRGASILKAVRPEQSLLAKLKRSKLPSLSAAGFPVTEISYHIWSGDHTRTFYTPHR